MNVSRETRAKSFSMPRPDNIVSLSIITYTFHIIWHELHSPEQRHRFQSYWWWAICLYPSGYVFHNHSVYTISYVFASGSSQTHTLYTSLNLYFFTSSRNYQIESRLAEGADKILHLKYCLLRNRHMVCKDGLQKLLRELSLYILCWRRMKR